MTATPDIIEGESREIALLEERGLTRPPDVVLEEAQKAAAALKRVIDAKPRKVSFQGETYLELEDWELLGEFYGYATKVEWTKPIQVGEAKGWEARAVLIDKRTGLELGAAEAMCLDDERNWKQKDDFQRRSMAQTRASAKAFRHRLSWIPVLAGYKGTPSEEVEAETPPLPVSNKRAEATGYVETKPNLSDTSGDMTAAQRATIDDLRIKPENEAQVKKAQDILKGWGFRTWGAFLVKGSVLQANEIERVLTGAPS